MNKKYQKPMLKEIKVMALESLSAFFDNFDSFSGFEDQITGYQFASGFKGGAL